MGTVSIPSAAALLSAFAGVDLDAPPLTQMSGRKGSHVEAGFYLAVPLMALRRASFTRRCSDACARGSMNRRYLATKTGTEAT